MSIKTAGELRGFLADILIGIRDETIDVEQANAIAKVAGQINQSLAVEAKTAIELQKMGKDHHIAGSMTIASGDVEAIAPPPEKWCEQCDKMVSAAQVDACGSKFCKARKAA